MCGAPGEKNEYYTYICGIIYTVNIPQVYHICKYKMKKKTSFTLSEDCLSLLSKIAEEKGLSMAATIELVTRDEAKRLKIKLDKK